jgi:hypothetical protein
MQSQYMPATKHMDLFNCVTLPFLLQDYFADLEHWLFSQWIQPPPTNSDIVRQAQLKFAWARQDTAEQMIELLTENFNKANSPYADRHTFVIRLDCPAFSLEPFHIENNKTSEVKRNIYT